MKHYDYETRLASIRRQPNTTDWVATAFAVFILLVCIAIGLLGLLLPILPGLLFLAFAALIAAKLFPSFGKILRNNRVFAPYLQQSENFSRLSWRGQLRFVCWMTLKVMIDGIRMLLVALSRLVTWLRKH